MDKITLIKIFVLIIIVLVFIFFTPFSNLESELILFWTYFLIFMIIFIIYCVNKKPFQGLLDAYLIMIILEIITNYIPLIRNLLIKITEPIITTLHKNKILNLINVLFISGGICAHWVVVPLVGIAGILLGKN